MSKYVQKIFYLTPEQVAEIDRRSEVSMASFSSIGRQVVAAGLEATKNQGDNDGHVHGKRSRRKDRSHD